MSITAKELAKQLGLSRGAVSVALNGKPGVSEKTRRKVLEAAQAQGFDFSRLTARPTPATQAGTIFFIVYKRHGAVVADTPFFSELSKGISMACNQLGLYLRVSFLYGDSDIQSELADLLRSGCTGMILLGTEMQWEDFTPFQNLPVPLVVLDTWFERTNANFVLINNVQGAYLATSHLMQRCKAQPGYLRSSYPINNFSERADGFYKAIRAGGMSTSKSIVHLLSPSVEGAYSDMTALLDQGEEPARCYFADNDLIAAGAIRAFRERGYRIPKDIAVVGFDDMPLAGYNDPPITTIHVASQEMGEVAVCRLNELIAVSTAVPVKIEISTKLIKRKSV